MRQFGELVGRHPVIVPVPVLTPQLSSYWLEFVTSVPTNVARALIEGLEHDVLADDAPIRALIPLELTTYRAAAAAALADRRRRERDGTLDGRVDALPPEPAGLRVLREALQRRGGRRGAGGRRLARSRRDRRRDAATTFSTRRGQARACVDELVGGIGLRRGRRDPDDVVVGDAVDFWRVVARRTRAGG